jgi:hypothetical protein
VIAARAARERRGSSRCHARDAACAMPRAMLLRAMLPRAMLPRDAARASSPAAARR